MKSKFEDLQCPCGCELAAEHRLERLYCLLKEYGFTITGLVNCASGNNTMKVHSHDIPDLQEKKLKKSMKSLGFSYTAEYDHDDCTWLVTVGDKKGVVYK